MKITPTPLPGVVVLTPQRFEDSRGFFSESWNEKRMAEVNLDYEFVQENHSFSVQAGTVRGLHFQTPPYAQDKLVRCGRGSLFDVAVDIRVGSPTFGQWVSEELSFENGKQLLLPKGVLHGFMTLTNECEIIYKCTQYYAPEADYTVAWGDPEIGIRWPDVGPVVLSPKDAKATSFADLNSPFVYGGT